MKNRSGMLQLLVALLCLMVPAAAWAGGNNNAAGVPTLDGVGLASLAGGLAIAGSWLAARRRNKK